MGPPKFSFILFVVLFTSCLFLFNAEGLEANPEKLITKKREQKKKEAGANKRIKSFAGRRLSGESSEGVARRARNEIKWSARQKLV